MPKSIKKIGDSAFVRCENLSEIKLPSGLTDIGETAFVWCESLTDVVIPEGITNIKYGTFAECSGLESVDIPAGVTIIESSAFADCTNLTDVELPDTLTGLASNVFEGCESLKSIDIPDGVTKIKSDTFRGCSSLESVKIPKNVDEISIYAFTGCSGLKSIIIDKDNNTYDSRDNCNAIIETEYNWLLLGCSQTVIPTSVTGIGVDAFSGCIGLTSIKIPNSISYIGNRVFNNCTGLTNVEYEAQDMDISSETFKGCSGLTSFKVPFGVTRILDKAFMDCINLKSIEIPLSVKEIDDDVFANVSDDFKIICEKDSYAYKFAIDNNIPYEAVEHQHNYEITINKANPRENGSIVKKCTTCEDEIVSTIYAPKTVILSADSFSYDGNEKEPTVTVKDSNNKVIDASNYSVVYINNKNIGTATVKISFKGDKYLGVMSKKFEIKKAKNKITGTSSYEKTASAKAQSFKINLKAVGGKLTYKSDNDNVKVDGTGKVTVAKNFSGSATVIVTAGDKTYSTVTKKVTIVVKPAATNLKSVKNSTAKNASKGKITVTWNKISYATGYVVQYSTTSNFKSGTNKIVNVKGASCVSKVINGLLKNKTYYVRIRTYKTIAGKNIYSAWSAKNSVKIGK